MAAGEPNGRYASHTGRRHRLPRRWSNTVLRILGPHFTGEVINVSAWRDQDKEGYRYRDYFPRASAYYISNYVDGSRGLGDATDITDFVLDLTRPLPEGLDQRFDVVFSHTTLEHIFDITAAFANLCRMSKDVVIVVVPFAQAVHGLNQSYGDYWRFTPQALRHLFAANGLEVVYEACNQDPNSSIYVLSVGSRYPERWHSLPPWRPLTDIGTWIGVTPFWRRVLNYVRRVVSTRRR